MSFKGLHGVTRAYKRLRWVTVGFKASQRVTAVTGVYKGLQGVARGCKGLEWDTRGYRGLQAVTGDCGAWNA